MAGKLTIYRGATYDEPLPLGMNLTGCTVYFTVKSDYDEDTTDASAVISKDITVHDDAINGISRLTLTSADTDKPAGNYLCDIHVKETASGKVYPFVPGKLVIKPTVTLRS